MNSALPDNPDPNFLLLNGQSFGYDDTLRYLNGPSMLAQTSTNSTISTPPSTTVGQHSGTTVGQHSGMTESNYPSTIDQHPLGASSTRRHDSAAVLQQARSHNADCSLGQLLMMYPAVQQLHNRWADANEKISLSIETQSALVKENMRLSNELRELTASRRLDL